MTDENKIETVEIRRECFCKSEWFKKFLTKTLAVFVGTFCALSLFSALHRPKMPPCPYGHRGMIRPAMHCHYHHFKKHDFKRGDFYRKMEKREQLKLEKRDFDKKQIEAEVDD